MSGVLASVGSSVNKVYDFYLYTLSLADQRTQGWPLVDSPLPTAVYTALYLAAVWLGPRLMRGRKPLRLTWALLPYNLAMAALNLYIASELLSASTKLKYSYVCQPITRLSHPEETRIASAVWWYYMSKLIEFCDTFFFILRKKNSQLTFLHVYHHSTMFSLWWIGVKWVPGGSTFLPAMANSLIHVLMYTYYALSALGPGVARYLWWKKYLTILQLIQFTIAMIMGIHGIKSGCDFPIWMQYTLVIYMISFIVLFGNFYAKAYLEKGAKVFYGEVKPEAVLTEPWNDEESNRCLANGVVRTKEESYGYANGELHMKRVTNGYANGAICYAEDSDAEAYPLDSKKSD
ncbi:very long chain fatty acid elongase 4-like [Bacillus rossius redtenbacheri]|uniref:very long chain fatty acid elongase 4-like n=1 Tax=Bacillus rossius redtenbacheri TaxID=93214 RepID=UPI002FDCC0A2